MKWYLQFLFFLLLVTQFCFSQWYQQNSGTSQNLYSVQFTDSNNGFAVGDSGTIINTHDGGTTWHAQISGTGDNLRDIFFMDSNRGWAVGYFSSYPISKSTVLYTSNSGINWTTLWVPEKVTLNSIYFIDSLKGWVVGDTSLTGDAQSEMWRTTDGGASWISQYKGETHTILFSVYFIDSNNGWAVGSSYSSSVNCPILKTTDGGINWIDITSNFQGYSANSTHFSNINNGWIVGESNAYKTTDGGISWVKNDSLDGRNTENYSVSFTSPDSGWIVGFVASEPKLLGYIAKTTNGGDEWSILRLDQDTAFFSCFFINSLTGWVVGSNGFIFHTTNGGITFIEEGLSKRFPTQFSLSQNYPNPFNPSTKIKYSVPQISQVQIKVLDVLGNEIKTLVEEEKPAGTYELTWNAAKLPSGVYFYQMKAGEYTSTRKMILLK